VTRPGRAAAGVGTVGERVVEGTVDVVAEALGLATRAVVGAPERLTTTTS